MRKSYGFRTFRITELALYHALGKLPEPELTMNSTDESVYLSGYRRYKNIPQYSSRKPFCRGK